jgi:hypothetical protein
VRVHGEVDEAPHKDVGHALESKMALRALENNGRA